MGKKGNTREQSLEAAFNNMQNASMEGQRPEGDEWFDVKEFLATITKKTGKRIERNTAMRHLREQTEAGLLELHHKGRRYWWRPKP